MSENEKKPSFSEKLKSLKVNRASVISAVVLIAAVAVIITVSVISNRAKQEEKPPIDTNVPSANETDSPSTPEDTTPNTTPEENKTPTGGSAQVQNKLPSFSLPTLGKLTEKHDPDLQVYSNTLEHYRVHLGIDIATEDSAPVYAAADGTVSKIWSDELMGYCIAIKHSGNSYTFYKNLSEDIPTGIKEGKTVKAGDVIGSIGDSALAEVAEEPHLHFEMTVADLSVDPLAYFDEAALKSLNIDTVTD